jgi:hypothetical protein
MKTRELRMEPGQWQTRSVLECGSLLPLSHGGEPQVAIQSASGLAQSKTWRSFVASLAFLAIALTARAQYSIDWSTIDGGGGTSTGSVYSVTGTIGQPDAGGPMTNGQFSVTGGFWALPTAVQTTNAPTLTIVPATPGQATISWTPNTSGFVLQENLSLATTNWVDSPSSTNNPVTVPATFPAKFYRLIKP